MSENTLRRVLADTTRTERAVEEAKTLTTRSLSESRAMIRELDRQISAPHSPSQPDSCDR